MKIEPSKLLKGIEPYVAPLDGRRGYDGLLLDFNEKVIGDTDTNNLYPEYGALRAAIAQYCEVEVEQILLTAGSGSAIDLVFRTYCEAGDEVIIPKPSFALLSKSAERAGAIILSPAYDELCGDFPLADVMACNVQPKTVVICNPNNPTGTLLPLKAIRRIAKKFCNSIVLVDEAYFEYSGITAVGLINKCPNVVVLRTFSKGFGLAALRVGYVVANTKVISNLQKVCNPYDIAMPSAVKAKSVLNELESLDAYIRKVMNVSKPIIEDFFVSYGIPFFQSAANFIMFQPPNPEDILDQLKRRGILIRNVVDDNTYRVTVGDIKSAQYFVQEYKEILSAALNAKIAFLDRDGTIIYEPPITFQVDTVEELKLLPGVVKGLQKLMSLGFDLVMITNQDGLGSEQYSRDSFVRVQNAMLMKLAQKGIRFTRVLICPHFPTENCECRKPKLGLLKEYLNFTDRNESVVIGDRASDVALAGKMGLQSARMLTNGNFLTAVERLVITKENIS